MRVIAGAARRVNLVAPAGLGTRPTADRAKESLFNILAEEIRGAVFLDIFCGSGAVGIEALSRGAREAIFVDSASAAIKAVRENLVKTKLSHAAEIMEMSAEKAIACLAEKKREFDIIFLDPPYASGFLQNLCVISQAGILAENGTIIAETDAKHNEEAEIGAFHLTSARAYGRTKFLFYKQ